MGHGEGEEEGTREELSPGEASGEGPRLRIEAQPPGRGLLSAGASSLAEISQANQLTLQQAVETSTKMSAMVSNVLKKSADTSSSIASNLK